MSFSVTFKTTTYIGSTTSILQKFFLKTNTHTKGSKESFFNWTTQNSVQIFEVELFHAGSSWQGLIQPAPRSADHA